MTSGAQRFNMVGMTRLVAISARFPTDMYEQIKGGAIASRRSLNMELIVLVEEALKEREAKKLKAER